MLNKCPICNSQALNAIKEYPGANGKVFYTQIIDCDICHSGVALPYKNQDELNAYYSSGAYWDDVSSSSLNVHTLTQAKFRVDLLLNKLGEGRRALDVLDVGAGQGGIAEAFSAKHVDKIHRYYFVEPDAGLSKSIMKKFSFAAKKDFESDGTSYDLIFLNHILEHTASPVDTLKSYGGRLNQNGMIYIEVPNRDDKFKSGVFPHSIFFSETGLRKVIDLVGLKVLELSTFGSVDSIQMPASTFRKLRIKILNRLFAIAVAKNFLTLAQCLDRRIFKYDHSSRDGIWIRAVCAKI